MLFLVINYFFNKLVDCSFRIESSAAEIGATWQFYYVFNLVFTFSNFYSGIGVYGNYYSLEVCVKFL